MVCWIFLFKSIMIKSKATAWAMVTNLSSSCRWIPLESLALCGFIFFLFFLFFSLCGFKENTWYYWLLLCFSKQVCPLPLQTWASLQFLWLSHIGLLRRALLPRCLLKTGVIHGSWPLHCPWSPSSARRHEFVQACEHFLNLSLQFWLVSRVTDPSNELAS